MVNPFSRLEAYNLTPFERQQLTEFDTGLYLISHGHYDLQTLQFLERSIEHVENAAKEQQFPIPEWWEFIKYLLIARPREEALELEDD